MDVFETLIRHLTCRSRWPHAVALCALSFVIGLGLVLATARPVAGRWIVPQTTEPATVTEQAGHGPEEAANGTPSPAAAPVPLPDQVHVPILMYHYVSELPANADRYRVDLTVRPEDFRAQLQYLADAGYHAITLMDLYLHLSGGYPLPDKPVVLTFDDGYRDAYEVVFPMLIEHGFTGTFFVLATPAHFEWNEYLTWAQIKEMADAGLDIQAHGRDHVDLRGRSYDFLVYQVLGIKEAIEYHTGQPVRFFCYPSGQYDLNVIETLKSAGYLGAVTTQWGSAHAREGLMEMSRVRVRGQATLESFIENLE